MEQTDKTVFTADQLRAWGGKALTKCGLPEKDHAAVLDNLVTSNLRGIDTHGINLIMNWTQKFIDTPPSPMKVEQNKGACILIDGGSNMGSVVSTYAMDRAMEKASEHGIGIALVKNSNHYGAAGYFTLCAAQKGFIGFTSTTALVNLAPWGSLTEIVGKNPFSVGYPWQQFPIVLDVSCSVAARQKVIAAAREGRKIPKGWALDKDGNDTTDAKAALEGVFLPMGEYKGVGIAIMIDMLIAGLCRGGWSSEITQKNINASPEPSHVGHIFVAIDPEFFLSRKELDTEIRMFYDRFHACKLIPGCEAIYLPGELEWNTFNTRKKEGIPLVNALIKDLDAYADRVGIPHLGDATAGD